MNSILCSIILLLPTVDGPPPEVQKYLQRCEAARLAEIKKAEDEMKSLERNSTTSNEASDRLKALQTRLKQLRESLPPLIRLQFPPAVGDMGLLESRDDRLRRSVDVLEIVDEDEAIVRAWYWPSFVPPGQTPPPDQDATFVDIWVQGVDTNRFLAKSPAKLNQVFQVIGNKLFDTTCGRRSLPLLEPIDIARYRGGDRQPSDGTLK